MREGENQHWANPSVRLALFPSRRLCYNTVVAFHEKIRVGVLRGGPSSEYDVSLKTGAAVLQNLPARFEPLDIYIDRHGLWHFYGRPTTPEKILSSVDAVWNALHGEYGEDGTVQHLLETFRVPFTGSRRFASAVAMNKALAKEAVVKSGVQTPHYEVIKREETPSVSALAHALHRTFPQPSIIKPAGKGSSLGVRKAADADELAQALDQAFSMTDTVIIEEFIAGREATVGVVEDFRGKRRYALFPIEIVPPAESPFFDYYAKYSGKSQEICPGNFSDEEKAELETLAEQIHGLLGLRHYSRSDFIVHPRRGVYFLEANTLPGLTLESLLPKALAAAGETLPRFLEHVLDLSLRNR